MTLVNMTIDSPELLELRFDILLMKGSSFFILNTEFCRISFD